MEKNEDWGKWFLRNFGNPTRTTRHYISEKIILRPLRHSKDHFHRTATTDTRNVSALCYTWRKYVHKHFFLWHFPSSMKEGQINKLPCSLHYPMCVFKRLIFKDNDTYFVRVEDWRGAIMRRDLHEHHSVPEPKMKPEKSSKSAEMLLN
jgi:hypothetical protein